jgi:hypothetical protein
MPTNSYIFPVSGMGFDRSSCLTSFASIVTGVSGIGYLGNGTYEQGEVYVCDGFNLVPSFGSFTSPSIPAPIIFGDWVYYVLGGALPTAQPSGGLEFMGGASGNANWTTNLAYTGTHALQIQTNNGGVLGFDSALPMVNHVITGLELFSVSYQAVDNLPEQIEIQLYESSLGWHKVYVGTDHFGLGGTNKGIVPPALNQWIQITFSPLEIGLTPGMVVTGMAWGVWKTSGTSTVVFSDTSDLNASFQTIRGFVDTCQDGNTGFYILSHFGPLFHIPAVGTPPLSIAVPSNPSFDYTGLTFNPTDSNPYFIGYDSSIYKYNGASVITVTPPPSGITAPARQLFNDGSNLYTLFANNSSFGKYNVSGNAWTISGIPLVASIDTLEYSNDLGMVLVGGSNYISLTDANTIEGLAYALAPNQLLITDVSNVTNIYDQTTNSWSLVQTVSGTGSPVAIATEPDGNQALVVDTTNNLIQVLTNVAGNWSATSTVPVTAPTSIVTYTSGITQAIVCQPSQNQVSFLNKSVTAWAVAQTLSIPGATSVAITKNGSAYDGIVTNATGITFIRFNGVLWSVLDSVVLNPVPTLSASDLVNTKNTNLYAIGSSGGNSTVYIFTNHALIDQYTLSGTAGTLSVINFQVAAGLNTGDLNVGYSVSGNHAQSTLNSLVPPSPRSWTWISQTTDFYPVLMVAGANSIYTIYNNYPQSFARATDSIVAVLSGASWNLLDLQDKNLVASVTTDVSGNIFAITTDNDLYKFDSLGTIVSGYPYTLIPSTNQEDGIPLGISKLVWWKERNGLYGSSSLMGGIVKITP